MYIQDVDVVVSRLKILAPTSLAGDGQVPPVACQLEPILPFLASAQPCDSRSVGISLAAYSLSNSASGEEVVYRK
jgi:hypothetical protein